MKKNNFQKKISFHFILPAIKPRQQCILFFSKFAGCQLLGIARRYDNNRFRHRLMPGKGGLVNPRFRERRQRPLQNLHHARCVGYVITPPGTGIYQATYRPRRS